jgi:CRP/FNR family transcriptional regulator
MHLADGQRDKVLSKRKTVKYRKGEVICKQGAFASKIMFLKKGLVKTYLEHHTKDIIFCIKPPGSFIGFESLFNERVYPYTCTVYEDSEFCMFEAEMFQEVMEDNGKFASAIVQNLNMWISRIYDRIVTLTQKQVNGKLADILICLSERVYMSNEFTLGISRKDLSEITQLSPETLSRTLKVFKEDGVIAVEGRFFKILDPEKLKRYSEIG